MKGWGAGGEKKEKGKRMGDGNNKHQSRGAEQGRQRSISTQLLLRKPKALHGTPVQEPHCKPPPSTSPRDNRAFILFFSSSNPFQWPKLRKGIIPGDGKHFFFLWTNPSNDPVL